MKVRPLLETGHVRGLQRGDLPALTGILDATGLFPPALLEDMAEPFLGGQAPHLWLVAEAEKVLGAYALPERITEGTYSLLAIAVCPEHQGSGVGKALVTALSEALRARGARILLIETSSVEDYGETRSFYSGQAFVEEARVRDFYKDGEDKVVFWKRL